MPEAQQPEYNDPPAAQTADALNAPNANTRVADAFGAVASSPLKPQSPLAANKDESDIGRYEYGRARAEQPYLKGAEGAINSPRPPVPSFEKIKREPNPEDYHKYSMEFASAAAVLGAIAGRWTRAGGTASLNAFAGALNGWQKGNVQAYEEASKQWEQASKKTIDNNNIELQKYKAILEDRKMNIDEKLQGLTVAGYENQNSVIVGMGKDGNFNGIAQAVDKMGQANERYGAAVGQLSGVRNDQRSEMQGQIQYLNDNPDAARDLQQRNPAAFAKIAGTAHAIGMELKTPPPAAGGETLDADAERYRQTGTLPPNMGRGQQGYQQARDIRQRATELEIQAGGDPANWPTQWQQFKAQGSGLVAQQGTLGRREANVAIFVNEAGKAIPIVRKLAEENAGKGFATWDVVEARWKVETGDRGFANYVAQLNTLINIYGRVATGGASTGAFGDREHARGYLNPNMPLSAVEGSLDGFETEVGIAKAAPGEVQQDIRNKNRGGGAVSSGSSGNTPPPPPGFN